MSKYDEQFKLETVRQYLSGKQSYEQLARERGASDSVIKRWVSAYRIHGRLALSKQHERHSARFKVQVLERIRREGLSDTQAVAIYNLRNAGIIGQWRRQYDAGGLGALAPKRRGRPPMPHKHPPELAPKDMTAEQLREENAYLRAELDYLKKLDALIQAERTEALVKKRKWSKD